MRTENERARTLCIGKSCLSIFSVVGGRSLYYFLFDRVLSVTSLVSPRHTRNVYEQITREEASDRSTPNLREEIALGP